ncbi:unnamed protein product [Cladocopium goreaui]|uniref:Glucosidase 2 subunit beta n=1 Tax=Cladocopium goreaui TaxID=2562237 RepID=A0A9P1BN19_9DINO|nr:unnamed protein product [Cladocopium goreaui]
MRWTLLGALVGSPAAMIRGVAPEMQGQYAQGLRCNGQEVAASAINDNYCDCEDGSDEPGTGACSGQEGTLFHCANVGSTPRLVYASRVGDGICDCCDGSDEDHQVTAAKCSNTCKEEGERSRAEREAKLKDLRAGLQVKTETISQAKQQKQEKEAEIHRIDQELPALETKLTELRQKKEEADAEKMQAECKTELPRLRQRVKELEEKVASLEKDLVAGDGTTTTTTKKVVSEYAKWMEGADAAMEEDMADEDDGVESPTAPAPAPPESENPSEDPLEKELKEMESQVKSHKAQLDLMDLMDLMIPKGFDRLPLVPLVPLDSKSRLKKELDELPEDKLGFASLRDKCLEYKTSEYTYKLCFFQDAKQSHTRLGQWERFTSPTEAIFKNGEMCGALGALKMWSC